MSKAETGCVVTSKVEQGNVVMLMSYNDGQCGAGK